MEKDGKRQLQEKLKKVYNIGAKLHDPSYINGKSNGHILKKRFIAPSSCFRLSFGRKDAIRLKNVMYGICPNLLKLERKYDKFDKMIKYRQQKYGDKYGKLRGN